MTRPPRTQKQIEASRANGAKSKGPKTLHGKQISAANSIHATGPVTPDGKAISSRNSRRHSLLAASVVLPTEAQSGFKTVLDELFEELQPETTIESQLVEVMAVASWRRMRMWCVEMGQVSHALLAQQRLADPTIESEAAQIPVMPTSIAFGVLCAESRTLPAIQRFEAHLSREYRRARREFKDHRADRLARAAQDPTQEKSFHQQTEPEAA